MSKLQSEARTLRLPPAIVFLCRTGQSFIVLFIQHDMNVLVIGAAGMIGRKFCEALGKRPSIGGNPVDRLTMADAITPAAPAAVPFSVRTLSADISAPVCC